MIAEELFNYPGRASVVIDGQFGSTGKGLIAAYLAQKSAPDIATTNASANAGHTTILADGTKFVTFHLPTASVVTGCPAFLNAGSIIDPVVLNDELEATGFNPKYLHIHPRAAVILPEDKLREGGAEAGTTKSGSTQKGVGAALCRKIMREAVLAGDFPLLRPFTLNTPDLNDMLRKNTKVAIEVPQGFSLGINSGLAYPHCTSRDVTVMQGLADACVNPFYLGNVMMTLRTYPIRVGNIMDGGGNIIGWSGPGYTDQTEIDFETIGVPAEYTTVTKRKRRLFTFSMEQLRDAVSVNRPDMVFLNFCNYIHDPGALDELVSVIERVVPVSHFGFGPSVVDVRPYMFSPPDAAAAE